MQQLYASFQLEKTTTTRNTDPNKLQTSRAMFLTPQGGDAETEVNLLNK